MPFSRQGAQGARLANVPTVYVPGPIPIDGNGAAASGSSFDLGASLPDMIVTDITWTPTTPVPGDHVVFSGVVQNIGAGSTPDGTIVDCLFTVGQGGVEVARTWEDDQSNAIASGASVTMTANGSPTTGVNYWVATAGTFQVVALANGNNRFTETDVTNNTRTETLVVTAAPPSTPDAPVLGATAGNATVALSWTIPANNGSPITSYRVRRDGTVLHPPDTTTSATVYTDSTVVNNVSYSYTVAAVNANGEGPASAPVGAIPFSGGAIPAIPATILGATPANKLMGWTSWTALLTSFDAYDYWKAQFGFNGFSGKETVWNLSPTLENMTAIQFWHTGTDVTAVVDPLLIPASYIRTFAYHHAFIGNQAPPISGGTWGLKHNAPGFGIGDYKRVHPDFYFFLSFYFRETNGPAGWPYMGDWYDDARWAGYARTMSNLAAGAKHVGATGLSFDAESPEFWAFIQPECTSTTRPTVSPRGLGPLKVGAIIHETDTDRYYRWTGSTWELHTLPELYAKVEARGFQFGQAIFNQFPDCQIIIYSWTIPGGIYVSKFVPANYPGLDGWDTNFYNGIMRAMQVANGANSYFWEWDANFYNSSHILPEANIQRTMQNIMALRSQRLPPAVRDFIMRRFAVMLPTWATGSPASNNYNYFMGESDYSNNQQLYRKWSGNGWRSEYCLGGSGDKLLGPSTAQGSPLQNVFTDTRTNPPGGHLPGLQAALSATPQDSTPITVGGIGQSRAFNTVTLTFTAAHSVMGIRNVHWTLYAANGVTVTAQGEAVMVFNENGGTTSTNFNNAFMACTITIPNATAGLYVILDVYTVVNQRTSRRVQLV